MIKSMTCNLMVENVKEATKFYVDVLDFKIVDSVEIEGETIFAIFVNVKLKVVQFSKKFQLKMGPLF